jgi:hypothetical protein
VKLQHTLRLSVHHRLRSRRTWRLQQRRLSRAIIKIPRTQKKKNRIGNLPKLERSRVFRIPSWWSSRRHNVPSLRLARGQRIQVQDSTRHSGFVKSDRGKAAIIVSPDDLISTLVGDSYEGSSLAPDPPRDKRTPLPPHTIPRTSPARRTATPRNNFHPHSWHL